MGLPSFVRRLGHWAERQLLRWDSTLWTGGLLLLTVWLAAGIDLRGRRLATWLAVPALIGLALVFLVGPGHLFPKEPYEGPTLLVVSPTHALTALDLPGLACAGAAGLLGSWLVWARFRKWGR